jgi:D-alanyl-D-alanine endopeptidase (penicillin-binding protein 7)
VAQRAAFAPAASEIDNEGNPLLHSAAFMIADQATGNVLLENSDAVLPIASITKLMTAMVVLDARLSLGEILAIARKTWTPCATAAPTCRWAPS